MAIQATSVIIYIKTNQTATFESAAVPIGDDYPTLACMQNAVWNIDNEFLDTTTKGEGKVGSSLQSNYKWSLQGSGVVELDQELSGHLLLPEVLNGKSVWMYWFAGTTLSLFGRAIISNFSLQSNTGSVLKFSATFKGNSEIYYDSSFSLSTYYMVDSSVFRRVSATTELGFTESSLAFKYQNNRVQILVAKNNVVLPIELIGTSGTTPSVGNAGYHNASGTFNFNPSLVSGDVITVMNY